MQFPGYNHLRSSKVPHWLCTSQHLHRPLSSLGHHTPSIHSRCPTTTMPRKLKAASPALSPQLRRSSRPIPSKANYVEKMTEDEGDSTSPWDGAMHTPPREKTRHTMDIDSNGVERAVRGLKRTEDHFRRATKRQKLKVEESSLHAMMEDSVDEGSALKSRTTRAADVLPKDRKTVSRKSGSAPDLDRMAGDNGGTNGTTGDFYRPGNDEADDGTGGTSDSQERGAARPPAVNSSYLPLPWKGRLGYVGFPPYRPNVHLRAPSTSRRNVFAFHSGQALTCCCIGLSEYLPAFGKANRLLFPNMSHGVHR